MTPEKTLSYDIATISECLSVCEKHQKNCISASNRCESVESRDTWIDRADETKYIMDEIKKRFGIA